MFENVGPPLSREGEAPGSGESEDCEDKQELLRQLEALS